MTKAYKCDYCHEFTLLDFAEREGVSSIRAVKGKHTGGTISYKLRVDNVPANSCQQCAYTHLKALAEDVRALK